MAKKKQKFGLVDDWKNCWRWLSVNCMVLAASIQGAWVYVPADMKQYIPQNLMMGATVALLALGVIGRLVKQGGKNAGSDSTNS